MATSSAQLSDAGHEPDPSPTNTSSFTTIQTPNDLDIDDGLNSSGEQEDGEGENEEGENEEGENDEGEKEEEDPEKARLAQEKRALSDLLLHNAMTASYRNEPTSTAQLTWFPKFAPEIRILIVSSLFFGVYWSTVACWFLDREY